MNLQYDVFISYRRDGGEFLAHNLYERLNSRGFSVFQDVESLRSGNFNTALYDVIEHCTDVIVLLPAHGLDRCVSDEDWVRKEIAYALERDKNIVPIFMPGFEWPEALPPDICPLRNINGLTATTAYFDEFIEKLIDFLKSKSSKDSKTTDKHQLLTALLVIIYGIGLSYPLLHIISADIPFPLSLRVVYFLWILAGAEWVWNRIETHPKFASKCFDTIQEKDFNLLPEELYSKIVGIFGTKALVSTDIPTGFVSYYHLRRLEFGSWDGKNINYLRIVFRKAFEYYDPSVFYIHSLSRGNQAIRMLVRQGFILQAVPEVLKSTETVCISKNQIYVFLFYKRKKLDHMVIYHCRIEEMRNHLINLEK